MEYIDACKVSGGNSFRIIMKHLLPNCLSTLIVTVTLGIPNAIMSEASLSFLGLGVKAPMASWGSMISFSQPYIRSATYYSVIPGLAIIITVLAFNMLGDGLRDALDPKDHILRSRRAVAVQEVSFNIKPGETLGVVGESGCGKSMTALSLMQLIPSPPGKITAGEIMYKGEDLLKKSPKEMRDIRGKEISMIFQEPMTSLNPVITVGKQIMEAVLTHEKMSKQEAKERALEMIKLVGIPMPEKVFASCPHQLSGGMRQRIMIAMALSCNPSLLICDEPTTALDVTIQAQILKLINKMKKELNTAVLLITHDMGVISEMADNVIVMYAGKIVEYTNVEDLFKNPLHPYTIGLKRSIPDIDSDDQEELEVIPGSVPMLYELPKGCFFAPRCKHAKEICHQERPAMMEHGENHLVRCWKYHERWNKEDVENGK